MGKLYTPEDIAAGFQTTNSLNSNFTAIETALDACLSRTGGTPNSMSADLDMDSNDILNVGTINVDVLLVDNKQVPSLEDIQEAFANWDDNTSSVLADATAAKDAAETAQAAAETAQTGAETAETNAETAQAAAEAAAADAAAAVTPVGTVLHYAGQTAPSGWLERNGETIGSATSAADYASADYENLYTLLWDNFSDTDCPVTGGRGASAANDWAADKPIGLMDDRGLVERGFDDTGLVDVDRAGTGFGGYQEDAFQGHEHTQTVQAAGDSSGIDNLSANPGGDTTSGIVSDGSNGTPRISSETRMKNRAYLPIIKY